METQPQTETNGNGHNKRRDYLLGIIFAVLLAGLVGLTSISIGTSDLTPGAYEIINKVIDKLLEWGGYILVGYFIQSAAIKK